MCNCYAKAAIGRRDVRSRSEALRLIGRPSASRARGESASGIRRGCSPAEQPPRGTGWAGEAAQPFTGETLSLGYPKNRRKSASFAFGHP
jgi:hypothetical protein